MSANHPKFSVVIPIFNEQESIDELYKRLTTVMDTQCSKDLYEILLVNDGSTDKSWQIIEELHRCDMRVQGLNLSRNFGHHIAITAGLEHAQGEAVLVMDGDLQDPPEEIPKLLTKFDEGYDLVYGIRKERYDTLSRKISSLIFWKTITVISGLDLCGNQSMLRIMSRKYVRNIIKCKEKNRWLPGIYAWVGFSQAAVEIEHSHRLAGNSKYNFAKMLNLAFNAMTSFSLMPLQLPGISGAFMCFLSFIIFIFLTLRSFFFGIELNVWLLIILAIFFTCGLQLVMIWLVGQYLWRIFTEVQNRPLYIIEAKTNG